MKPSCAVLMRLTAVVQVETQRAGCEHSAQAVTGARTCLPPLISMHSTDRKATVTIPRSFLSLAVVFFSVLGWGEAEST
jgi:hypothetical protein